MEKFPFTAVGFLDLQEELYGLTDLELQVEVNAIRLDFYLWMDAHFTLTTGQLHFLANIDPRASLLISNDTSFAIENRLPISLNKESDPPSDDDDQGKIIWPKSTLSAKSGGTIGYEASGVLVINIAYQTI